jgi:hypothetical protein
MHRFILSLLCYVFFAGCALPPANKSSTAKLEGVYEGREVVDTEERISLRRDGTFTYDFIPLGQNGESYSGRWKSRAGTIILTAKMDSGEDEAFMLEVGSEKGEVALTYSWASQKRQRATMLIPNVFVRSKAS